MSRTPLPSAARARRLLARDPATHTRRAEGPRTYWARGGGETRTCSRVNRSETPPDNIRADGGEHLEHP